MLLREAAEAAGITKRQADHWYRVGYIHPVPYHKGPRREEAADDSKTGLLLRLPDQEAKILVAMAWLVTAGLCPATAAKVAREHITTGRAITKLTPHVHVLLTNRADGA